jgi:hypothetical protein
MQITSFQVVKPAPASEAERNVSVSILEAEAHPCKKGQIPPRLGDKQGDQMIF